MEARHSQSYAHILSIYHADMCVSIDYLQDDTDHATKESIISEPMNYLFMTKQWLFDNKQNCLRNEYAIRQLTKEGLMTPPISMEPEALDENIFLIAIFQYAVTNMDNTLLATDSEIFKKFGSFYHYMKVGETNLLKRCSKFIKRHISPETLNLTKNDTYEIDKTPKSKQEIAKLFTCQSNWTGLDNIYVYIVEVMTKLYLIHHEQPVGGPAILELVNQMYERSLKTLWSNCMDGNTRTSLYAKHIPRPENPTSQLRRNNIGTRLKIIEHVRLWFSCFIVQRFFGRRISLEHFRRMETKIPKSHDIQYVELDLLRQSIHNGKLDTTKFVAVCFEKLMTINNTGLTPQQSREFRPHKYMHESTVYMYPWLLFSRQPGIYMYDFMKLFVNLYEIFNIQFGFQRWGERRLFPIRDIETPQHRDIDLDFQLFDVEARRRFSKYIRLIKGEIVESDEDSDEITEKSDESTSTDKDHGRRRKTSESEQLTEPEYTLIDGPIVSDRDICLLNTQIGSFINKWFSVNHPTALNAIRSSYERYKENSTNISKTADTQQNNIYLGKLLRTYIDNNTQIPISSINAGVVGILDSLQTEKDLEKSLGVAIDIASSDYFRMIVPGMQFATPEPNSPTSGKMPYWGMCMRKFEFITFLGLASIHSHTYGKNTPLNVNTSWLHCKHPVTFPGPFAYHDKMKAFKLPELRNDIFPWHCLQHFCHLFPCSLSQELIDQKSYSLFDLMRCMAFAGLNTLCKKQYEIFEWSFADKDDSVKNRKNIVDHTICVILILSGVNALKSETHYGDVFPPLFTRGVLKQPHDSERGRRSYD